MVRKLPVAPSRWPPHRTAVQGVVAENLGHRRTLIRSVLPADDTLVSEKFTLWQCREAALLDRPMFRVAIILTTLACATAADADDEKIRQSSGRRKTHRSRLG